MHWHLLGKTKSTPTDSLEPSSHGIDRLTNFEWCPTGWQHSQSWLQWTAPSFTETIDLLSQSPAHFMCHFRRRQFTSLFSLRIITCERPSTILQELRPSPRVSDTSRTGTTKIVTSVLATLIVLPRNSPRMSDWSVNYKRRWPEVERTSRVRVVLTWIQILRGLRLGLRRKLWEMSVQGVDNLENLGRRQLQQLCKSFGIKANKKVRGLWGRHL